MRKALYVLSLLTLLVSCKAKQAVVSEQAAGSVLPARDIIEGHYRNAKNFSTVHITAGVNYKDKRQSQNVSADIRIKKDEKILVSVRFLGITMAKALITPQGVSYYEKIGNKYFEGNYALLSNWLGTPLDFNKVQNLLLGEAVDDLNKGDYTVSIEEGKYKLKETKGSTIKEFLFEGANYLLKKQSVAQGGEEPRSVSIDYPSHTEYPKAILPAAIKIEALQKEKINIGIEYNSVTFDEDLSFPYDVPEGFDQIFID